MAVNTPLSGKKKRPFLACFWADLSVFWQKKLLFGLKSPIICWLPNRQLLLIDPVLLV